jgi:8-oxo-dGTP diphosphatase
MDRFSVAAYAVVRNERGEVLLTRRRDGDEWVLPGGTVEHGEPPWDAMVREVREETGLEVEVDRLVGAYAKKREADLVLVFEAPPRGGEVRESDERDAAQFFAPGELPDDLAERDRERIEDALSREPEPFLRVQPSSGDAPTPGTR